MSYTHIHLPEIEELKFILKSNPDEVNYYAKYEAWIGSVESVSYLTEILTKL